MQIEETFRVGNDQAEKSTSPLSGTENSMTGTEEEELAEYGDAAALRETFGNDFQSEVEETTNNPFAREDYLRYQIDKLITRIESGYSDRQYELWSQHRDPKYVTSDRDLLESYEKELQQLEAGE